MTRHRTRAGIAAVVAVLAVAGSEALAQKRAAVSNVPGPGNTVPAIRRGGSMSFPSIRMGGWGVRSKQPRGIGKVDGTLLRPVPDARRTAFPDSDVRTLPNGGAMVRGRGGQWNRAPWSVGDGASVSIGTGGIDGRFAASGDNWAIAASLNNHVRHGWLDHNGWKQWRFNDRWCHNYCGAGYAGGYYVPGVYGYGFYDVGGYADPFVYYGSYYTPPAPPAPPPAQAVVNPEASLSVPEKAALRLQEGKPDEAIVLLRPYVDSNPDENEIGRALAIALIDARRTQEGIAVMALMYERDPRLASVPINPGIVGGKRDLRDLVVRVVEHGHRTNTSSVWLTAAVLMQTEGRDAPAGKMVDRAEALGLDTDVVRAMRLALKR